MADLEQMKQALRNAHEAGDVETATKLAKAIKSAQPPTYGDENAPRLDRKTGAPPDVRALVGGTDRPDDRLATLRNFYPDARPYDDNNFIFTNPETGRPTLYNPPGFLSDPLGDVMSTAREITQTATGTLGGLLGAGLTGGNPGGAVTGATVGTGLGEELFNFGARQFGMEDTRTPAEKGFETGVIGLSAGAGGGTGATTGAGIRGGIRQAIRGRDVEGVRNAIDDAAAWNGVPSVATATTPERINGIEGIVSRFPGGAGVFRRVVRRTNDKISEGIRDKSARIARRQDLDPDVAGTQILEGIEGGVERFKSRAGKLYDEIDQYVDPQASVPTANARAMLTEITEKIDIPELNKLLTSPTARNIAEAMPDEVPYETLKQIRSAVGDRLSSGSLTDDIPTGDLKRLYGAITKDMEAAVGPDGLEAFRQANAFWKNGMNEIDKILGPIARKKAPEEAYNALLSGAKKGPTRIRSLRQQLSSDQWNVVVGTVVRDLGRVASKTDEEAFGNQFSLQMFLKNWRNIDESARREMFNTPDLRQYKRDLDALGRWAARAEESSEAFANPSGTARATAGLTMVGAGAAGPLLYPLFGANALGVTAAAGSLVLGANVTSRLLTSPKFVRWLAQGTKIKPNGVGAHIGRLADVAAGGDAKTAQAIGEYLNILEGSNE